MKFYKEVAMISLFHNGKQFDKGATVRERVPITDVNLRELEKTPELTNCKYILIEDEKPPKNTDSNAPKKWSQMNAEERKAFQAEKGTPKTE